LDTHRAFKALKQQLVELEPFDSPAALVRYLHGKDGDLDQKDQIYAALVRTTQEQGEGAELASTLLWLGLWPALDATYRRLFRLYCYQDPAALVSEMGVRFTNVVHHANLDRIDRVAATLKRNLQREILNGLKRQWADYGRSTPLPGEESENIPSSLQTRGESRLGIPFCPDVEEETRALRVVLTKAVGSETDADLAIGTAVLGLSHRELAEHLGMSHGAVRKRIQRVFRLLRVKFKKVKKVCPILASKPAFKG
jgi:RNA polymerase sigma-70 factor (ECF subfamily)